MKDELASVISVVAGDEIAKNAAQAHRDATQYFGDWVQSQNIPEIESVVDGNWLMTGDEMASAITAVTTLNQYKSGLAT